QDGVPLHCTPPKRLFFKKHKSQFIDHPPSSPDLNPIENCWSIVKHQLVTLPDPLPNIDDLFKVASKLWLEIPQKKIDSYIDSMEERRKAVLKLNRFSTQF
ncbi:hypothetical protein TREMEDRAFT_34745, partial [Tremella mesenterica DSM 1558]|uniref:uncharacterized protein n=1 Tax=Tremella mesenterica (strain ATCC 24925 / CBS 8224 / DSM 1558 / NBRC 9311 / NRRL Y-6157 / RJB 2259-6 / UBC 559-6) TaxID=578456 RepID=UPI00032C3337